MQPEGIAWVILDAKLNDVPNWRRSVRSDQPPVSAETLADLAVKLGIDTSALELTVAQYNAACGDGKFDPLVADGLRTAVDYQPSKLNWARPIDTGPFMAYPVICGNCFTFGGIKTNARGQVVNADGETIPGLYAAGEMTGLYYGTYTGATSVLRGAVFGRIAGSEAVHRD
jgi:tricarballylate dehydrogenase